MNVQLINVVVDHLTTIYAVTPGCHDDEATLTTQVIRQADCHSPPPILITYTDISVDAFLPACYQLVYTTMRWRLHGRPARSITNVCMYRTEPAQLRETSDIGRQASRNTIRPARHSRTPPVCLYWLLPAAPQPYEYLSASALRPRQAERCRYSMNDPISAANYYSANSVERSSVLLSICNIGRT